MRIDVHHHFPESHREGCQCHALVLAIEELHDDVRRLQADVTTLLTREAVPQEVVEKIDDVLDNVSDNFLQEPHDGE